MKVWTIGMLFCLSLSAMANSELGQNKPTMECDPGCGECMKTEKCQKANRGERSNDKDVTRAAAKKSKASASKQ